MSDISGGSRISQSEGAKLKVGCQPIIWPKFVENCMKMKEIGPRARDTRLKFYYVDVSLDMMVHIMLSDTGDFKNHMENLKVFVWNRTIQKG